MIDYDGLSKLAYQIKTETGRAANTAIRVGTLFENIIDAVKEGDNTGLLDQITNLKKDISKVTNMIKDLNIDIDTSIIARIKANEENILNINSTIQVIQKGIKSIEGTLSNHLTLIQTIQGQVTAINNSIGTINTQLTSITNTISGITSDLTALTTKVNKNETNIAELKARLDVINIAPITAAIDKLTVDLTALTGKVANIDNQVDVLDEFTSSLSRQLVEEEDRATAAEQANTDAITALDTAYKAADAILDTKIDTLVTAEEARAKGEENRIETKAEELVNTEMGRAKAAEITNTNAIVTEINRADTAEKAIAADLSGHISNTTMHTTQAEKNKLSNLASNAEATYAKKTELPDMSDVFYKSKGGTVSASTTFQGLTHFQNSLDIKSGQIQFIHEAADADVNILKVGQYQFMTAHPTTKQFDFGEASHVLNLTSSSSILRVSGSDKYKIWDAGNDGSGSGLDADLLDGHHWSEISSALSGYLPLSGGTMTGTIILPKSGSSRLGIAGPSSSDVFLGYNDVSNYFGSTNKITNITGSTISIAGSSIGISSSDKVSINAVSELLLVGPNSTTMRASTLYWTIDASNGIKLLSNKNTTAASFDVFDTTYDPIFNVKTKARIKTSSSGSTSYGILHEGNSVYVVSSYPTDLSSYPDGAIFIKTS